MAGVGAIGILALCAIGSLGGSLAVSINHPPSSLFSDAAVRQELSLLGNPPSLMYDDADANLTVPEIIEKYGYPVEVHDVTTEDGYILQLHRIPYGKNCGPAAGKRVMFIQHGLLCDSSNWIQSGVDKSLGYLLADACYDVWLGNARGNTYSRKHVTLDPSVDKDEYWSFSFHEMGVYDLPANIDYIMGVTGTDGIYYTGHSMGTTMFWICMSERPEYNSKIKLMNALAPVAFTEHMISPLRFIAPHAGDIEWLLTMIGVHEFAPSNEFLERFTINLCKEENPLSPVCANFLFLICGFDPEQIDTELIPTMLGHLPAGTSVKNIVHYAQGVPSGKFQRFDHGAEKNMVEYGQATPPEYDLTKITAPVIFYWGENDWLGTPTDTERIGALLPNLQVNYRVTHHKFNHLDFLVAKDIRYLLNDVVMYFLTRF